MHAADRAGLGLVTRLRFEISGDIPAGTRDVVHDSVANVDLAASSDNHYDVKNN
jgi:hypothetical protein